MKIFFVTLLLLINAVLFAQNNKKPSNIVEIEKNDNVKTEKIYSDSTSSYYVLWIKDEIKLDKHKEHSEKLLVIEGVAKIVVGEKAFKVKVGDYFVVAKNEAHSIKTISKTPVKFIAIRSKYDRIEH